MYIDYIHDSWGNMLHEGLHAHDFWAIWLPGRRDSVADLVRLFGALAVPSALLGAPQSGWLHWITEKDRDEDRIGDVPSCKEPPRDLDVGEVFVRARMNRKQACLDREDSRTAKLQSQRRLLTR